MNEFGKYSQTCVERSPMEGTKTDYLGQVIVWCGSVSVASDLMGILKHGCVGQVTA